LDSRVSIITAARTLLKKGEISEALATLDTLPPDERSTNQAISIRMEAFQRSDRQNLADLAALILLTSADSPGDDIS
jgi:hypothetical protein